MREHKAAVDPNCPVGVVVATRNRAEGLSEILQHLLNLPEQPPVVVVDNASTDGSADRVEKRYPGVTVLRLEKNLGAAARNEGAAALSTPYVAFCDDDSWWAPGSLARAAALFEQHPRVGLLAARVLVGADERVDPTCEVMANSALGFPPELPGPRILGFIACGAVVRREAYLDAGGFNSHFGVGGEEDHLALTLAARGWDLAYVEELVVYHHPSPIRDKGARLEIVTRNSLWTTWLLRSGGEVLRQTAAALRKAAVDERSRRGVWQAVRGLPWVFRQRRPLPAGVEQMARALAER
ncbi:MAG TPA: glycosyltransferase [Actinomycetota bacterium]|nr:glycosyltransferase [Actinomycetota bacterium]